MNWVQCNGCSHGARGKGRVLPGPHKLYTCRERPEAMCSRLEASTTSSRVTLIKACSLDRRGAHVFGCVLAPFRAPSEKEKTHVFTRVVYDLQRLYGSTVQHSQAVIIAIAWIYGYTMRSQSFACPRAMSTALPRRRLTHLGYSTR